MEDITTLTFPLRGTWKLFHIPGHHKHAYDFVGLHADTRKYLKRNAFQNIFSGGSAEDWYGWRAPILAPCNGRIVQIGDGWPDRYQIGFVRDFLQFFVLRRAPSKTTENPRSVAGNFIVIKKEDGILVFLCHIRSGSVKVAVGGRVNVGDPIGEVGNSGNALSPHLHLNLFIHVPLPLTGQSILRYLSSDEHVPPFRFEQFDEWNGNSWSPQTMKAPQKGKIVRS